MDLSTCEFFLFPEAKLRLMLRRFDSIELIQKKIRGIYEDDESKFLPAVLPILEIPLESLYQCRWGLLQTGWKRIENSVVGKVATEEFLQGKEIYPSTDQNGPEVL
jgi:hypothetical protein